jgi:hypothetical protein
MRFRVMGVLNTTCTVQNAWRKRALTNLDGLNTHVCGCSFAVAKPGPVTRMSQSRQANYFSTTGLTTAKMLEMTLQRTRK